MGHVINPTLNALKVSKSSLGTAEKPQVSKFEGLLLRDPTNCGSPLKPPAKRHSKGLGGTTGGYVMFLDVKL